MIARTFAQTVVVSWLALASLPAPFDHAAAQDGAKEVARQALPSVVTLMTYDNQGQPLSQGSGFIVRPNGVIVTNYHVIRNASAVKVTTRAGDEYDVNGVLGVDVQKDFAILQIRAIALPVLRMNNSEGIEPGEMVFALGAPRGYSGSVTTGTFSQLRQQGGFRMMQHSAAISPGSSGGPLLLASGQVVGVNTLARKDANSLFFALPIDYVNAALEHWDGKLVKLGTVTAYVQQEEEKAEKERFKEEIRKRFTEYRDPDNLFTVLVPRRWQMQRNLWADEDGTIHVVVMGHADDAQFAELNGWLSHGIRLHLAMPMQGRVWRNDGATTWIRDNARDIMAAYSRSQVKGQDVVELDGLQVHRLLVAGITPRLREAEAGVVYHAFHPQGRAVVELVTPASKTDDLELLQAIFEKSLKANWAR
jgi:hypothetical protein